MAQPGPGAAQAQLKAGGLAGTLIKITQITTRRVIGRAGFGPAETNNTRLCAPAARDGRAVGWPAYRRPSGESIVFGAGALASLLTRLASRELRAASPARLTGARPARIVFAPGRLHIGARSGRYQSTSFQPRRRSLRERANKVAHFCPPSLGRLHRAPRARLETKRAGGTLDEMNRQSAAQAKRASLPPPACRAPADGRAGQVERPGGC